MNNILEHIANNPNVRAAREAVENIPPPVKKIAKAGMIGVGAGAAVFAAPPLLGFTASGVAAGSGSVAAAIQSAVYGAAVPAGSLFAIMQSVGATATIVPALVAGVSATGIAGAVEAGQGQRPGEYGGEREANNEEPREGKEDGDPEKHDETEGEKPINNGKSQRTNISERLQRLARDPSPCSEGSIRVTSPDEDQGPTKHILDAGHDGEIYRPRNNQS
ncbi:unnamed protein product [Rhizoctonia solani]|uniref:Uncharacterized protein n=1 Tax=Rhizoctonia solani TaxID=456999 RepID=A0A8H3H048_9AGAM|nr:unnamed protein product [Rhizoctonia solani]